MHAQLEYSLEMLRYAKDIPVLGVVGTVAVEVNEAVEVIGSDRFALVVLLSSM